MLWARGCVRRRDRLFLSELFHENSKQKQKTPATPKATPHHKERLNNMALFKGQWWLISHINRLLNSLHLVNSAPFVFMQFRWWSECFPYLFSGVHGQKFCMTALLHTLPRMVSFRWLMGFSTDNLMLSGSWRWCMYPPTTTFRRPPPAQILIQCSLA